MLSKDEMVKSESGKIIVSITVWLSTTPGLSVRAAKRLVVLGHESSHWQKEDV
jgi:hypothetical protein